MLASHFAAQEKALYAALVALEEGVSLTKRLSGEFNGDVAERLNQESRQPEAQAESIRQLLKEKPVFDIPSLRRDFATPDPANSLARSAEIDRLPGPSNPVKGTVRNVRVHRWRKALRASS